MSPPPIPFGGEPAYLVLMITPLNFNFAVLARLAAASVMTAGLVAGAVAAPASAHPKDTIDYVALGDSYSAGVGAGQYVNACGQTPLGFPALLNKKKSVELAANASCGGAMTEDLISVADLGLPPQVLQLKPETDLVTLTIGGNDVGFGNVAANCSNDPNSTACAGAVQAALSLAVTELPRDLVEAFTAVRQSAPKAHVVVMGYPQLFSPQFGKPATPAHGAVALNAGVDQLNTLIESAAASFGFQYIDVTAEFRNHGIGAPDSWIIESGFGAFHPTAEGYKKGYFKAFKSEVQLNKIQKKSHSYK